MVALQDLCGSVQAVLGEEVVHVDDVENARHEPVGNDRYGELEVGIGEPRDEGRERLECVVGQWRELMCDVCGSHGGVPSRRLCVGENGEAELGANWWFVG